MALGAGDPVHVLRSLGSLLSRHGVPELQGDGPMKRPGKFDGVPTMAMFEVADPGEHLELPPKPFGRGEQAVTRVICPLGHHWARVIDDGEHLRYATHWPIRAGVPMMCLASMRCTAEFETPVRAANLWDHEQHTAANAVCRHDKRKAR